MKAKPDSVAPPIVVTLAFVISRLFYLRAGLRFDSTPPKYYYQFIDPQLLQTRLWESLWYLHSQPPLFNLFTGLLYRWFSPQSRIYQILFWNLGLVFALVLYWLGLRLGLKRWVSALLTLWFMVSPATVLYENLYFYTYLTALLLVFAALSLSKFLETDRFWWGFGFASAIAALCLTWAIFHLVWMVASVLLVAVFYRNGRRLALISILPVLLVFGWYSKNYVLFSSFGASSWAGMNLSHVTFFSPLTTPADREELIAQQKLTDYPVTEAFRSIDDYKGLFPTPSPRGVPVLDENIKSTEAINFNHLFYIPLSRRMMNDAVNFIQTRPGLYLASVKQGFVIYFHSSSDYLLLKDKPTPRLETWWDGIFYGQWSSYHGDFNNRWKSDPAYVGWFLVIEYAAAIIYGLYIAFRGAKSDHVFAAVVIFLTFTILYFTLLANVLDLGENNRFRFTLDPVVLLLFGKLLQERIQKWVRKRLGA